MKKIVLLLMIAIACTPKQNSEKQNTETIGDSLQAHSFSDIYFSGQPGKKDYAKLKEQGFVHVINIRQVSEYKEKDEKRAIKGLGLYYSQIPFAPTDTLTNEYIEKVTTAVKKHGEQGKTLIHCGSGQRVGLWVGGHFYKDHKYDQKMAREMAQNMGLTSEGFLNKLDNYFVKNSKKAD